LHAYYEVNKSERGKGNSELKTIRRFSFDPAIYSTLFTKMVAETNKT